MHTRTAPNPTATFKPVAVVDWISFIVKLARPSHGGYLKRAYEAAGVSQAVPMDAGAGNAASTFRIDLQHPGNHRVICDLLSELERCYGLSRDPVLHGVEVSVDFLPMGGDSGEGAVLTRRLMMSLAPPVITNPRLASDSSSIMLPTGAAINIDMTLYVGNIDDNLLWRVYWKRTDDTFVGEEGIRLPKPLPESEWRARAEVRIQGDALQALSLITPMDLEGFRFEKLYSLGYFKFCYPAPGRGAIGSNPYARFAAQSLGVDHKSPACMLGKFGRRDVRGRRLKLSRNLLTDHELGEAARSALRSLTRRF